MTSAVQQLIAIVDQAYNRHSCHGANLRGSIRGVSAEQAAWRPAPGRHNIWEIVLHAAYWKYVARRRLTGDTHRKFPLPGKDFFRRPEEDASEIAWRRDVALLDDEHRALREAVAAVSSRDLARTPRGGRAGTGFYLLSGVAAHDLYHAGQIQLLKRLFPGRS